jgi:hypothetical protein
MAHGVIKTTLCSVTFSSSWLFTKFIYDHQEVGILEVFWGNSRVIGPSIGTALLKGGNVEGPDVEKR